MTRITHRGALHIAWTFPAVDALFVNTLREHLAAGQESGIFDLQSWDCRDGRACAVLNPLAPLEDIVAVIWGNGHNPMAVRWWKNPTATAGSIASPNHNTRTVPAAF
jgi:hypothetical protein